MEQKALVLIVQHWPTVAYQTALGFLRTCLGPGSITVASSMPNAPSRATRALLVVLPLAEILALWVLAAIGVSRFLSVGRTTRAMQVMLVGCVVLLVLPASATLGQSRFRVPAVPALAILGAIGGEALIRTRRDQGRRIHDRC